MDYEHVKCLEAFNEDISRATDLGADLILLSTAFPLVLAAKTVIDGRFAKFMNEEVRFMKKNEGNTWKRLLNSKGVAMLPSDVSDAIFEYMYQIIRTQMSFNVLNGLEKQKEVSIDEVLDLLE